jgi:hypothetical protein
MKAMKTMGSMFLVVVCIGLFIATLVLGWDWVAHGKTPWTILQRVELALAKQNDSDEKMRQWAIDHERRIHALPSTQGVKVRGNFEGGEKFKICTGYGLLENAGKDRDMTSSRGETSYEQSLSWVEDEVWVECN